MEEVAPDATAWLDEIAADAEAPLPPEFSFLRDQLLANSSVIQDTAMNRSGERTIDRTSCEKESEQAADLLADLILPLGLDAALDTRAILLGGWLRAFKEHGDSPAGMVKATADVRLQDLVGKAMEMSVVVKAWEKA